MSIDPPRPGEPAADLYRRLAAGTPPERLDLLLRLIEAHPQGRLDLSARDGLQARLDGIDLSPRGVQARLNASAGFPAWWEPEGEVVNLRRAGLQGASLRLANLQGVLLEEADASGADLAGVNLQGAALAGASLEGALLEDADLQDASLRFARLEKAVLEGGKLPRADLWGASGRVAVLAGADLQGAILEEADFQGADFRDADLRGAILKRANLQGANLQGANLQGAVLGNTNLRGAVLRDARLQEADLTGCDITHAHTGDAWLDRTRLHVQQLGGAIGEELAGEYEVARRGYLALERNFESLGDPDAASWAYGKKRRMQKRDAAQRARTAWGRREWGTAAGQGLRWALDLVVEWVCDYGESIPRVLATLLVLYVFFLAAYAVTGTVVRETEVEGPEGKTTTQRAVTRDLEDLATFSLTAIAAPGNPPENLFPANSFAYLLCGLQALLGIFLVGLLGFVAGNRIHR
jgi:uncharacterized protein YjbI with pentapeptide repeats